MRLYFLRHGQADRSQWSGNDFDRPLTKQGKQMMAQTADTIAALDLGLDLILTSPLVRAQQTAEIVAKNLRLEDRLAVESRLGPGFDAETRCCWSIPMPTTSCWWATNRISARPSRI